MFDFNKVKDFDNHIRLSIPNYEQLYNTFQDLATIYSEPDTCVIDYGCSTGKFLLDLPKKEGSIYIGVDNSSLIPAAHDNILFHKEDSLVIGKQLVKNTVSTVIVSMFFLQFLSSKERKEMVDIFRKHVQQGATLLISEKVALSDSKLDNIISRLHIAEKRKHFTDTEILDKDKQLLGSMYILDELRLVEELSTIGKVTKIWQSFNFCGYVVR